MSEEGLGEKTDQVVTSERGRTRADTQIPAIARHDTVADDPQQARMQTADPYSLRGVRSPLIGRGKELDTLQAALSHCAAEKEPLAITILGNQGTGKSRLVDELIQKLPATTIAYRCRASKGGASYGTIARLLRERFASSDHISEQEWVEEFRREVQGVFGDQRVGEVLHVLGRFLDLEFPDSPFLRVLSDSPKQYDELSRAVLRRFIEVDARKGPLVFIVDDLQWADDASLSLLKELSEGMRDVPVTFIASARPELMVREQGWGQGIGAHVRVDLGNLEPTDAEQMFRHLVQRCEKVPQDIVDDAVEMTSGNPHFLDLLVRLYLSNGTINAEHSPWRIDVDKALETNLPITVEEAIEARIASLAASERAVLEMGAVFGNVFWLGAVVALSRIGRSRSQAKTNVEPADAMDYVWHADGEEVRGSVTAMVEGLVERDYLLRLDDEDSSVHGDIELVFKHNLERELIAKGTDTSALRRHHRLAAQWIETKSEARSDEQLEFLGQLYFKGGDSRRAAYAFIAGGDRARSRYANEQAIELYRRGLELLEEDDTVVLLDALHNLGSVLDLLGRTGEAQLQFSQMLRHAWLFDHRAKGGAAHNRLGRIHRRMGEYGLAMGHMRSAHELFEAACDQRGIAGTLDDIGQIHWLTGAYTKALDFHRQALTIRRDIGDSRSIALSLANIGRVHHETGAFSAASRHFNEALELRGGIGDQAGMIQSLCDLGRVQTAENSSDTALATYEQARAIAVDIGDKLALANVLAGLGNCYTEQGLYSDAIESLQEGKAIAQSLGHRLGASDCYRGLAETFLLIGDISQAEDNAARALKLGKKIGSRFHTGSAYRALAEASFAKGDDLAADEQFRKAVDILSGINNSLELARTCRAYAQLQEKLGRTVDATESRRRADAIFGRLRGSSDHV